MYHLGAPSCFHTQALLAAAAETILECSSDWLWYSAAHFAHPACTCDLSRHCHSTSHTLHTAFLLCIVRSGVSSSILKGKPCFYTVSCDGEDDDYDMQVMHQHLHTELTWLASSEL